MYYCIVVVITSFKGKMIKGLKLRKIIKIMEIVLKNDKMEP